MPNGLLEFGKQFSPASQTLNDSAKERLQSKLAQQVSINRLRAMLVKHAGKDEKSLSFMPRRELVRSIMDNLAEVQINMELGIKGDGDAKPAPNANGEQKPAMSQPEAKEDASDKPVDPLAKAIADAVKPHLETKVSRKEVESIVKDAISCAPPREITIKGKVELETTLPRQHYLFPLILKLAEQRIHGYLTGPAGSGKTQCVENAALALGLPFYSISVCSQSSEYVLKGYYDANGNYVASLFRQAYQHGGVFLIDEIDAGNPNIVACLNAALSNHVCAFPDEMVKRHDNFICFAAANTYGTGASREYVGRNPLDAATLDRFAFVDFAYDPGLEAHICGIENAPSPAFDIADGGEIDAAQWVNRVQSYREKANQVGVRAVFSPRASKTGAIMLKAGIGLKHVEQMLIFKGLDAATVAKIGGAK